MQLFNRRRFTKSIHLQRNTVLDFEKLTIAWFAILFLGLLWLLPATAAWGTAKSEAEYGKGILAYGKDNYAKARDHFQAVINLEPDNPHARIYLGLSLRRLGDFQGAATALQQGLQLDPSLSYVHYYLGVTFYQMGRDEQAQASFETFLATSPKEPEAGFARQNLKIVNRRRQRDQKLLQLEATVGFEYDDNVILEPNDEALAFGEQGDGRAVFNLAARLLPVNTEPWRLGVAYRLYQSLHFDLTEFNVQQHTGSLSASYKQDPFTWGLTAGYTYASLDNEAFSGDFTVLPSVTIRVNERFPTVLSMRYRNIDYFNQMIVSGQDEVRDRDGWSIQPRLDQYWLFGEQRAYVRFSYAFDLSRHDGSDWDYDGHEVSLGLHTPLSSKLSLNLDGKYLRRDYLNPHSFDAAPRSVLTAGDRRERTDDRLIGSIELQWRPSRPRFLADLIVASGFEHTSNFSNIGFFDYRRNIAMLRLTGRY